MAPNSAHFTADSEEAGFETHLRKRAVLRAARLMVIQAFTYYLGTRYTKENIASLLPASYFARVKASVDRAVESGLELKRRGRDDVVPHPGYAPEPSRPEHGYDGASTRAARKIFDLYKEKYQGEEVDKESAVGPDHADHLYCPLADEEASEEKMSKPEENPGRRRRLPEDWLLV